MTTRQFVGIVVVSGAMLAAPFVRAGDQPMPPGCAKIVAVLEESGGGLSADEVAKKTSTDVETVRNCTDLWRASTKDPKAPKAAAAPQPVPPGCAKIVAVLDQGGGLSADEIAKKTSTNVETVRNCTDAWRQSMKGGAQP